MENFKNIMTIKDFSIKTGLSIPVIRRLIKANQLTSFKAGNKIYINYLSSMNKLWNI